MCEEELNVEAPKEEVEEPRVEEVPTKPSFLEILVQKMKVLMEEE